MHLFVFFLDQSRTISVHGHNMIDAYHRSGAKLELKDIKSYKEGDGDIVHFSK